MAPIQARLYLGGLYTQVIPRCQAYAPILLISVCSNLSIRTCRGNKIFNNRLTFSYVGNRNAMEKFIVYLLYFLNRDLRHLPLPL